MLSLLYRTTLTFVPDYYLKTYRAKIGFSEKKMTFGKHLRMGAGCQGTQPRGLKLGLSVPLADFWGRNEELEIESIANGQ